jgi:hypothetical protein
MKLVKSLVVGMLLVPALAHAPPAPTKTPADY